LEDLRPFDVVHFAGHAVVNTEYPWLSHLVLEDSGLAKARRLWASDITPGSLTGTRVVVLASCSTAQGREFRGEGPMGLARSFLAAGVDSVVATIGPVDDRTMAEIAVAFHRAISRLDSAAALREAQLAAIGRFEPRLWASVSVIGV
jgi:CHAT domain-containing protein